jgi:autotransporter-associated beta strand protein
MDLRRNAGRCAAPLGLALLALASGPAHAQWNYYANGGTSFFVPFVSANGQDASNPNDFRLVSMSLNYGNGPQKTSAFTMDTGSLGINAGQTAYQPGPGDILLGPGGITYTSSGTSGGGMLYLTTVTINGQNGQTATARVPILSSSGTAAQMGVGFDRPGLQASSGVPLPNLNPFLGLLTINGQPVMNMNPGYIVTNSSSNPYGQPGVILGLTQQNTSNFSFVQLTPNGGLPAGCTTPGMSCPSSWNAATATVQIGSQTFAGLNMLPDSGIGYMILSVPNGGIPTAACVNANARCLGTGTQVSIFLPGQSQAVASYSFAAQNVLITTPTVPSNGVQPGYSEVIQDNPSLGFDVNSGRGFFTAYDYLYDPIGGFVGYRLNGLSVTGGSAVIIPLLALQGNLALQNGFNATFPTYLMAATTLQQTGSGTFTGSIFGPGSLTLNSGTVTLAGANNYTGGTTVNGGTLNVTGSITGDLAVLPGATFVNSGTVNSPGYWLSNQGTFTNSGTIVGNFANVATTTNTGTFTGSVINGTGGSFVNNGSVGGDFLNIGVLSGNGTIGGNFFNMGVMAPGNSIGTINVAGNFVNSASGTYLAEVVGQGQSDRVTVGGSALLQGGTVVVSVLPGLAFAPSTRYTLLSAAGGLSGTFGSVNELYPFLQSNLSYDANNAYLTLQVGGFAAQALNPTQYAVGSVLDASAPNASGDYATVLGTLATATAQQGQAFMTAISGNNYAGFSSSMVQGAQLFMNNFASQTGGGSPFGSRVALAEACDVACDPTQAPQWGAWGGGLGGLGTIGANQPLGTVTYNVGGFAAGLDRLITPTTRLGVTAGYTTGTQWVGGFDGVGRTDTIQTGLYGGYSQDKVYADAVIGYAYGWNQMWRNIPIPGLGQRTAQGRTGANQFFGQAETGYRFDLGTNANAFVTPFARLQAYTGTQNAFTETGAQSLNLTVAQQTTNSLRSVIGAQLGGAMDLGWREKLAMQFRLGWAHEYADTGRPVTATLAGAPGMAFTTYGVAPQRDGALVGFSANTAIAEATSLYLRYEGVISGQDSAHAITAGVRMTW